MGPSISTRNAPADQGPEDKFITFSVDGSEFAVDILVVREIRRWMDTTTLPNVPHFVRGVINLRGTVVPILDVKGRFGADRTLVTSTHVVIVVAIGERLVGLLVDAVSDIVATSRDGILPVPALDILMGTAFIDGIITYENRMIARVDLPRLFDPHAVEAAWAAANSGEDSPPGAPASGAPTGA